MVTKPGEILDRDREWAELNRIWDRPDPTLLFVLGRRRAGKSFLLAAFAHAVGGLYYQATKRTEAEQLLRLSGIVGEHFGDSALRHGVGFPDWESLFSYVGERASEQALLLVLDEFPHLTDSAPTLASIIQSSWDHRWRDSRLKLVLSGSHITAMRQLEEADQPLYGRRTARIDVEPFDFRELGAILPYHDARDRLRAYGVFGGLPGHLALLEPASTLGENVARHVLEPSGRLLDEAQHLLDSFLADAVVHYSIIEAVAGGDRTWTGISNRVGRDGGSLSRAMAWLIGMRLIERAVPITERNPERSKRALYRILDPYVEFWHRFVGPMVDTGRIGLASGERLWTEQVRPSLDDYMGGVFEGVCRSFVRTTSRLPFQPLRVGSWWDRDARNEIDVVAIGSGSEVLVGECKWGRVHAADVARLEQRARLLVDEMGGSPRVHLAVFSAADRAPALPEVGDNGPVLHFSAEDLFGGE